MIENAAGAPPGLTYRYFLNGQFADSGDVSLTFLESSWSYQFNQTLYDVAVTTPNEEGNKTNIEPGGKAPIVLEVPVPNHSGLSLDAETIGSGADLFNDYDNDPENGIQIQSSRSDVTVTIDLSRDIELINIENPTVVLGEFDDNDTSVLKEDGGYDYLITDNDVDFDDSLVMGKSYLLQNSVTGESSPVISWRGNEITSGISLSSGDSYEIREVDTLSSIFRVPVFIEVHETDPVIKDKVFDTEAKEDGDNYLITDGDVDFDDSLVMGKSYFLHIPDTGASSPIVNFDQNTLTIKIDLESGVSYEIYESGVVGDNLKVTFDYNESISATDKDSGNNFGSIAFGYHVNNVIAAEGEIDPVDAPVVNEIKDYGADFTEFEDDSTGYRIYNVSTNEFNTFTVIDETSLDTSLAISAGDSYQIRANDQNINSGTLPGQRRLLLRQLLRLLPAGSLYPAAGHLHREGCLPQ